MIIYFADRNLNIIGHASTLLPSGYRVSDDVTAEEVDSGVNTFSCDITYTDDSRGELEEIVQTGYYVLKQRGQAYSESENLYDSLYQIIDTEGDTKSRTISLYAEDAALDLLNKVCLATALSDNTIEQMMNAFKPNDWMLNLIDAPTGTKSYSWDSESTCTERLKSVADLFDCEIYYSFEIERFQVKKKIINVTLKRGVRQAVHQLRLGLEVDRIVTKKSIADLATAYKVTGGTVPWRNSPINLVGYSYSYTDPDTGDEYYVDTATGEMRNRTAMRRWASVLDQDGLITKTFTFDTIDQAMLAEQARIALQMESKELVNYDVSFASLPDDIQIGDRLYIIDEQGELYLEARLLKLETSVANDTRKGVVGEFLLRDSGISQSVIDAAALYSKLEIFRLEITSSAGDVFKETLVETTLTAHVFKNGTELSTAEIADAGVVRWYDHDNMSHVLGTGTTLTLTAADNIDAINVTARLEAD